MPIATAFGPTISLAFRPSMHSERELRWGLDPAALSEYEVKVGVGHKGRNRVLRGGSWNNPAENVRAAYRNDNDPSNRNANIGFRLSRAHRRCGGIVDDPAAIPSVGDDADGKKLVPPGVRVVRSAETFGESSPGGFFLPRDTDPVGGQQSS